MNQRLVFFGTPLFAFITLKKLLDANYLVVGVVTQKNTREPSLVERLAHTHRIPVFTTPHQLSAALGSRGVDLGIVAAYGQLLPKHLIEQFPKGILNIHFSLLPKYRGPAPVPWSILNGERATGVTIFMLDADLDTGAVIAQHTEKIAPDETADSLYNRLADLGSELLLAILPDYLEGKIPGTPQVETEASFAPRITKQDGFIEAAHPPMDLERRIRALYPWPKVWTIVEVKGGTRRLLLLPGNTAQLEGKKPVRFRQLLEGYPRLKEQLALVQKLLSAGTA